MTFLNRYAFDQFGVRRWDGYGVRCDEEGCESRTARVDHPTDVTLPPDWTAIPVGGSVAVGQKSSHRCPAHSHPQTHPGSDLAAAIAAHSAAHPPVQAPMPATAPLAPPVAAPAPAPHPILQQPPTAQAPIHVMAPPLPSNVRVEGVGSPPSPQNAPIFTPPKEGVPQPGTTRLSETTKVDVPAESKGGMQKQTYMAAGGGKVVVEIPKPNGQA